MSYRHYLEVWKSEGKKPICLCLLTIDDVYNEKNLERLICKYVENIICMGITYIPLHPDTVDFSRDVLVHVRTTPLHLVQIDVSVGFGSLNGQV